MCRSSRSDRTFEHRTVNEPLVTHGGFDEWCLKKRLVQKASEGHIHSLCNDHNLPLLCF